MNSESIPNVDEDESLLATPVADYWPDPALPNSGLAKLAASVMEISELTVSSEIVLPLLTIIWEETKHIEKMVDVDIEYRKCK